ncbi:metallophosphoesterase [Thermoproteota archaeon]
MKQDHNKMTQKNKTKRNGLLLMIALLILVITSFAVIAATTSSTGSALSGDIEITIDYPKTGGYIWVPKEVVSGQAYPLFLILSGGDGTNAYVGPGSRHLDKNVRGWIDSGKMYPTILVSPTTRDGSSASPINNFNINEFRLNDLISKVNQKISQYGISIDRDRVTISGHSNGGFWKESKPAHSGVYGIVGDASSQPLYAVAILDGTHSVSSAKFLHEKLDGTNTKVFSLIGKNRKPGELPTSWINEFLGQGAVPCGVAYDDNFFRDCKKDPAKDWYNYVTHVGGPYSCKNVADYDKCRKDNIYSHGTIPWKFFNDWLPVLYPKTLPPVDSKVAPAVTQAAGLAQPDGFRFVILGDTHMSRAQTEKQKKMIQKVIELKPSFVVSTGDMINGEKGSTPDKITELWGYFDAFIDPIKQAGIPFVPISGNHDSEMGNSDLRSAYKTRWGSHSLQGIPAEGDITKYYSFEYQGSRFIMMYAAKVTVSKEQRGWLEKELQKGKDKNILVFGHVPLETARKNKGHIAPPLSPADTLRKLLADAKVKAYFTGHNHVYNELDVNGIKQISTGQTVYHKGNGIPIGGTDAQEEQNIVVVDVIGNTMNHYFVLGPDFTKTADGREVPDAPSRLQAQEALPIAGTPPKPTGIIGLYDFIIGWEDNESMIIAAARYPLGLGVKAQALESVISLTPPTTVPVPGAPGVPTAAGTEAGDGMTCHYCKDAKRYIKDLYPDKYDECLASNRNCCEAPCPQGSVVKSGVPNIQQCSVQAMGAGGDCWHDGAPPERNPGSADAQNYCKSACGVASMKMALSSHNKDVASEDLFCGGSNSVYVPGGSVPNLMVKAAKNLGIAEPKMSRSVSWGDMLSSLKQGRAVVFLVSDKSKVGRGGVLDERCFVTGGHYILLVGGNDNFAIANDPGGHCHGDGEERMVLSKSYIEGAGKAYVVI